MLKPPYYNPRLDRKATEALPFTVPPLFRFPPPHPPPYNKTGRFDSFSQLSHLLIPKRFLFERFYCVPPRLPPVSGLGGQGELRLKGQELPFCLPTPNSERASEPMRACALFRRLTADARPIVGVA